MVKVRGLKLHLLFGILGLILLVGLVAPAIGQTNETASHVVINEADINPPGDDSKSVFEWVELYNPTDSAVDLGGWKIASTSGLKKTYTIAEGTTLKSGGFATFSYGPLWFPDTSTVIQLKNKNGDVVDTTATLRDIDSGLKSWQRITDGFDTNSSTDWVFRIANAGSSNGKTGFTTTSEFFTLKVSTDKMIYYSGDIVKINGEISKKVYLPYDQFSGQQIHLKLTGPGNFKKSFSLFPDRMNLFKTEMKTDKVLNVPEGTYKIVADYAGESTQTSFIITSAPSEAGGSESTSIISLNVDKAQYLPGETAILSANTSKIIPLEGLKFKIFDPKQKPIYQGSLFPDVEGKFLTTFFINNIKPVFGEYVVSATYNKQTTTTSYEVVPEIKDESVISLSTDKKVYGLGETVNVSGRSNKIWVSAIELQIIQSYKSKDITDTYDIKKLVKLNGDGTFNYQFKIPNEEKRYGDYKVRVSLEIGSGETSFKVVADPNSYTNLISKSLSISTDKESYSIGDQLVISGTVGEKKDIGRQTVQISITKADGTPIISSGNNKKASSNHDTQYSFTGIPDAAGNFEVKATLSANIFENGNYTLKAVYGDIRATTSFEVKGSVSKNIKVTINATTDKEIYGAGEKVILTGGVSTFTAQSSYTIKLIDPNGKMTDSGARLDNGKFSWEWTVPTRATVFGLYQINISSDSDNVNVFFKVSKDPKSEPALEPLMIELDKDVYKSGETVNISGSLIKQISGTEGLVINQKPEIVVKNEKNKEVLRATPDIGADGKFKTSLKLVPGVFKTGQYKVSAKYYGEKDQTVFKVDDRFNVGKDVPLVLLLETDKEKYLPGETVKVSGKTSRIISVFDVDVKILKNDVIVSEDTVTFDALGAFHYDYTIPQDADLGTYVAHADTDFDTVNVSFDVEKELSPETISPEESPNEVIKSTEVPKKITDVVNRIKDSSIPIIIKTKNVGETEYVPTSIEGTLRVNSGDEPKVNIQLSKDDVCIIGQADYCKITKSTREDSSLYKDVSLGETDLTVRYSGHGTKLEKFTILPKDKDGVLPEGDWLIEIIKEDQFSRFYYKISYTSVE